MLCKGQDSFDCVSSCLQSSITIPKNQGCGLSTIVIDLFDHLDDIPESGEFWGWVTDESSGRATEVRRVETNTMTDLDLRNRDSLG